MENVREEIEKLIFGYLDLSERAQDPGELIDKITSLISQTEPVAEVPCGAGLSDAERDMDMIFCLAIARTFKFGSPEAINLLEEYRELMTKKEEILEKIKGR